MTDFREPKNTPRKKGTGRVVKVAGAALLGGLLGWGVSKDAEPKPLQPREVENILQNNPVDYFPSKMWELNRNNLEVTPDRLIYWPQPDGGEMKEFVFPKHGINSLLALRSILPEGERPRFDKVITDYVQRNLSNPQLFTDMAQQMKGDPQFQKLKTNREQLSYFVWRALPFSAWNVAFTPYERRSLYHSMHYIPPALLNELSRRKPQSHLFPTLAGSIAGAALAAWATRKGRGRIPRSRSFSQGGSFRHRFSARPRRFPRSGRK